MGKQKFLVTGGAGMIGSTLVKRLVNEGHDVIVVDNLWRGSREYLKDDNGGDIIDMEKSFFEYDLKKPGVIDDLLNGVDYIYHLADIVAGIGYVFNNQGSLFRDNFLINSNIIDSVRRCGTNIKGFIYVGTACSFPAEMQTGIDAPPLREQDQYPASPESAYGWSKLMGEYEAFLMEKELCIPVSVLSLHNVYGAPSDFNPATSQVIPALVYKAICWPVDPFVVWGSGSQGRAFVHVDDVVDALLLTMAHGLGKGVIQIGPDVCISIKEIAETVVEISGKPIDIQYDMTKPEGDRGRCADYSKARAVLGWEPQIDLKAGLTSLYQWVERRLDDNR
ncbi:MAG: NAD-dependent epimerase/dehydratase family protein [Porticoccus sp.]|uniref:NAD-dependent epimerase/dehydratase family protein n=1 Tax=Porticoccus sp. TaxID=2024853 RepID=UPI003298504E